MLTSKPLLFLVIAIVFIAGLVLSPSLGLDLGPQSNYSCTTLARFHQDMLIKKYDIHDGFNTDQNNPKRDINQKASDLNRKLLEICDTDPTK